MVERFFGELTNKRIRRGVFTSVKQLEQAIMQYLKALDTGRPLLTQVSRFEACGDEQFIRAIELLLNDPVRSQEITDRGVEHVRRHFLITRLLIDELKLLRSL